MEKISLRKRLKSFVYAQRGINSFFKKEQNAWIHGAIALLVVIFGLWLGISVGEWIAVTLCIGIVLVAEALNTAIERVVDLVSPEQNKHAGEIKDIAAGAVLIASVAAAIVGLIIFLPKILCLWELH